MVTPSESGQQNQEMQEGTNRVFFTRKENNDTRTRNNVNQKDHACVQGRTEKKEEVVPNI